MWCCENRNLHNNKYRTKSGACGSLLWGIIPPPPKKKKINIKVALFIAKKVLSRPQCTHPPPPPINKVKTSRKTSQIMLTLTILRRSTYRQYSGAITGVTQQKWHKKDTCVLHGQTKLWPTVFEMNKTVTRNLMTKRFETWDFFLPCMVVGIVFGEELSLLNLQMWSGWF